MVSSFNIVEEKSTLNLSNCIIQNTQDIAKGLFPDELLSQGYRPITPSPEFLVNLADCERILIPMLERLNYYNLRSIKLIEKYHTFVANWLGIYKALDPNVIIFSGTPHEGSDFVAYSVAKELGIKTLILERTIFTDRILIQKDIFDFKKMPTDYVSNEQIDDSFLKNYQKYEKSRVTAPKPSPLKKIRNIAARISNIKGLFEAEYDTAFGLCNNQPVFLKKKIYEKLGTQQANKIKKFYQVNSVSPDFKVPYLYFPLNLQPERTTLPLGRYFWNHKYVLKVLLAALPDGWKIYVKDHPRQFSRTPLKFAMARDRDFYESLIEDERVDLIDLSSDSEKLIESSQCVATITGTAGWEAIRQLVPVLLFGYPWYRECPEILKVNTIADCVLHLSNIKKGRIKVDENRLKNYAAWIKNKASYAGSQFPELGTFLGLQENAAKIVSALLNELELY